MNCVPQTRAQSRPVGGRRRPQWRPQLPEAAEVGSAQSRSPGTLCRRAAAAAAASARHRRRALPQGHRPARRRPRHGGDIARPASQHHCPSDSAVNMLCLTAAERQRRGTAAHTQVCNFRVSAGLLSRHSGRLASMRRATLLAAACVQVAWAGCCCCCRARPSPR